MKTRFIAFLAGLLAQAAIIPAALAQSPGGTLQRIKDSGEIRVGHRESSVPFSYMLDDGRPVGFAMDLCARIVDSVKAELKRDVKVVFRPVTNGTQIPLLQNESVDIVCGPTTNTVERQKQVAFSNTYFVASIRAAVKRDSGINKFTDLAGKSVSLTSATTAVTLYGKYEQERKFESSKLLNPDHAQSFLMLGTGRAQAFVMDDILLASLIAGSAKPGDFKILDDSLRVEPYGLVLRKDDAAFKAVVDKTIADSVRSGEFEKLYAKWFQSPIPPKNLNLNFPMTEALKGFLANPSDKGID